ncbi:hypothetical protein GC170_13430 [bacterium]|nr:hypothetical protein [bacterium]
MSSLFAATLIALNLLAAEPKATHLYPSAITRGVFPVLVVTEGDTGTDPKIWTDDEALKLIPGPKAGQFLASAAPGCRVGWHVVRLHNKEGVSRPILLWVDDLRNLAEAEPNDHHEKAAVVLASPGSVRVHGRLERNGDVDGFRVHVPKGVTLTARVTANRFLASPMDATLQIVDTKGFVLAHNDDTRGTDPELVWTSPETGDVIVRLFAFPSDPNSTIGFAGGSAYIYSLLLATGPTIDRVAPIAIDAKPGDVPLFGWNLPADAHAPFVVPAPDSDFALIALEGSEPHPALRSAFPVTMADAKGETRLTPPVLAYGYWPEPAGRTRFRITAKKGENWNFRIFAKRWETPADPVLILKKADGTVVAEQDDSGNNNRDVDFAWTVPDDGEYLAEVTDLHRRGGPRFAFGLEVTKDGLPPELLIELKNVEIKAGDRKEITLTFDKRAAIDEPVKLTFEGLPKGFPEPKTADPATPAPAEPAKKKSGRRRGGNAPAQTTIKYVATITADEAKAIGAWSGPVRAYATDDTGKKYPVRFAAAGDPWPRIGSDHLWLTVIPPEPPKDAKKDEKKDEPKKAG